MLIIRQMFSCTNIDNINAMILDDKSKSKLMQIYINNSNLNKENISNHLNAMLYCYAINNGYKITFDEIANFVCINKLINSIHIFPFLILTLVHISILARTHYIPNVSSRWH
jgi:hypothetical protein